MIPRFFFFLPKRSNRVTAPQVAAGLAVASSVFLTGKSDEKKVRVRVRGRRSPGAMPAIRAFSFFFPPFSLPSPVVLSCPVWDAAVPKGPLPQHFHTTLPSWSLTLKASSYLFDVWATFGPLAPWFGFLIGLWNSGNNGIRWQVRLAAHDLALRRKPRRSGRTFPKCSCGPGKSEGNLHQNKKVKIQPIPGTFCIRPSKGRSFQQKLLMKTSMRKLAASRRWLFAIFGGGCLLWRKKHFPGPRRAPAPLSNRSPRPMALIS